MRLRDFQARIEAIYRQRDGARPLAENHLWFLEEVGELSRALRRRRAEELEGEFADVLAWLASLASLSGIDLEQAVERKYGDGCPACRSTPCACG